VWIGTEDAGLHQLDPRTRRFRQFLHDPSDPRSLPHDYVTAIMSDSRGDLWVGTYGGGLIIKDRRGAGFRRVGVGPPPAMGRLNGYISALLEDRDGMIWVGTWIAGLAVVDPSGCVIRKYAHDPSDSGSVPDNEIRSLALDRHGTVWVGTAKGGLSRYDPSNDRFVRVFPIQHGPVWAGTEYVQSIAEDDRGRLWLGTFGGGAVCFDPETGVCVRLTKENGLPNNVVYGIILDDNHRLWLSTNEGLACHDPAGGTSRSYTHHDGLQADEFNFNASCRGPDRTFCFGGVNGFNIIAPGRIPENRHVPPVSITGFRVFDKPFDTGVAPHAAHAVTLDHDANFISIEYASLDFALPERNQYAYRLEGIDRDWVHAGTRRSASYTDLPPGEYVFTVRGSNNDGVWNETGAAIGITVLPPYWQTLWFRIAVAVLIVAALSFLYRLRVRSLLKMERLRLRIASDLHDDIGSNLASIAVLADLVRTRAALAAPEAGRLQDISRAARHTSEALRDIVWFVNPDHDTACTVVDRLRSIASTLLAGVEHTFTVEDPLPGSPLPMALRRDLVLIYKEILSNIVRHAEATRVEIRFAMDHGRYTLEVRDNGKGFDTAHPPDGNGLMTMKRRAAEVGGTLVLHSGPGRGTKVVLSGKIP
jgi:signal transduction histidine kinase/streptogramin lyase